MAVFFSYIKNNGLFKSRKNGNTFYCSPYEENIHTTDPERQILGPTMPRTPGEYCRTNELTKTSNINAEKQKQIDRTGAGVALATSY